MHLRVKWDFRNDAKLSRSLRFGLVHKKCGNMIWQLHETEINSHFLLLLLFLFLTSRLQSRRTWGVGWKVGVRVGIEVGEEVEPEAGAPAGHRPRSVATK